MTTNTTDFFRELGGRSVDPSHLEVLGKTAAQLSETSGLSLTKAVVETIGHEKLNSEQVRRVVETANVEAFNRKYASLTGASRFVELDEGPADPAQVLQELNSSARPKEVVVDALEYSMPPDLMKRASLGDAIYPERTRSGVIGEVMALQSKLSAAHDEVTQSAEAARVRFQQADYELLGLVKMAGLQGVALEDLYPAWARVDPEMAKTALDRYRPLVPATNQKVAGRSLNAAHPVVTKFAEFAESATTFKAQKLAQRNIERELIRVGEWLSEQEPEMNTKAALLVKLAATKSAEQRGLLRAGLSAAAKGTSKAFQASGDAGEAVAKSLGVHKDLGRLGGYAGLAAGGNYALGRAKEHKNRWMLEHNFAGPQYY